jgi:ribosomal protein S18 acetylase RimI-like enzyme
MTPSFTASIRPYHPSDERAVIRLWTEELPDPSPHNAPTVALPKKLDANDQLLLVADVDGTVVGSVMGGYDGHRGWIYSLAVSPTHRRRGIGAALVRRIEAIVEARGCLKVNLQVRETNASVMSFYESLGYTVEPRISMGKRLN